MSTLKIFKKEYQRTGYDVNDIEIYEYTELIAKYDERGLLTKEVRYDSDGEINTLTLNSYDDKGLLIQTEQYDHDNVLLQKTVVDYNENGEPKNETNYYGDASDEFVTVYQYSSDNNTLNQTVYHNGELDYVEKITTFSNGRIDTVTENDDYDNPMYISKYQYDEKGRVSVLTRDEVQNKDRRTYEFTYDENDNRIKDLVYDYDMKLIAKIVRIFDENSRMLEYTEEDLDSYRNIKIEYSGDLVLKNTIFDKDGDVLNQTEFEYDENGKETLARDFIQDEFNPGNLRLLRETFYVREN